MLQIEHLKVKMKDKIILHDLNLTIHPGEFHALMGPNGSGKSTLAFVLAGHPEYEVVQGKVIFEDQDLLSQSPEERALNGLFLAFQYPIEIPGLANSYFIKAAYNAKRRYHQQQEIDAVEFLDEIKSYLAPLNISESLLHRAVNEGFSGGEKKSNEILQLLMLKPKLAILDETDSGLDIDTLKKVAQTLQSIKNTKRSFLLITHYQRILDYIEPDFVHIMHEGKIIQSGDKKLAQQIESVGYTKLINSS